MLFHQGQFSSFVQMRDGTNSPACGSWRGLELAFFGAHIIGTSSSEPTPSGPALQHLPGKGQDQLTQEPKPTRGRASSPALGDGFLVPTPPGPALLCCVGEVLQLARGRARSPMLPRQRAGLALLAVPPKPLPLGPSLLCCPGQVLGSTLPNAVAGKGQVLRGSGPTLLRAAAGEG